MANRENMEFMISAGFGASSHPNSTRPTRTVDRNDADDKLFATMHRNKANFSVEKASAAFANVPRRKIG